MATQTLRIPNRVDNETTKPTAHTTHYGENYSIRAWGPPYFDVNPQGNVAVRLQPNGTSADLYELVQSLVKRGIEAPILIRFDDILKDRIYCIQRAFDAAINEFRYNNTFRLAYPIKVNQQKTIVDLIKKTGSDRLLGLEVGSKPELIAVLSIHDTPDALLLCNGYKDAEYIEIALLATKVGRRSIIIIEQLYELQIVLDIAKKLNIEAEIGFRMRPFNKGSGRWSTSGGDMAKFGLSVHEIVLGLEMLKAAGKLGWVKLLHFHLGSQIPGHRFDKKSPQRSRPHVYRTRERVPRVDVLRRGGRPRRRLRWIKNEYGLIHGLLDRRVCPRRSISNRRCV